MKPVADDGRDGLLDLFAFGLLSLLLSLLLLFGTGAILLILADAVL